MKIILMAGAPACGKTSVLKHVLKKIKEKVAYFKIDVQFTEDDKEIGKMGIPARKIYSGELCPDHCFTTVFDDVVDWAKKEGAKILFIETAGLCFRCSPYITNTFGIAVLGATSGINLPFKIGPMLTLADAVILTKSDLISQAEKEVFIDRVKKRNNTDVFDVDALRGINIDKVLNAIKNFNPKSENYKLRGIAPVGVCTLCVGKKETGWKNHNGVLRKIDVEFYQGE